jgi:hypothetical protein
MDDVISQSARRRGTEGRGRSEERNPPGVKRERKKEEAEGESIVTTRLDFMNIIFQQMFWTIGRRRRPRPRRRHRRRRRN